MASESAPIKLIVRCTNIRFMRLFSIKVSGRALSPSGDSAGHGARGVTVTVYLMVCPLIESPLQLLAFVLPQREATSI